VGHCAYRWARLGRQTRVDYFQIPQQHNEPWYVNHSYNYNNFLRLNTTAAAGDISANDGGTEADPTSTVFSTYYINR
jgi:hypothetical protein